MFLSAYSQNRGVALIELLIIVPFLLFFAFGVFEFSRVIAHYKFAQNISREIANNVYRECSDPRYAERSLCLPRLHERIQEFSAGVTEGSVVIVGLYVVQPGTAGNFVRAKDSSGNDLLVGETASYQSKVLATVQLPNYLKKHRVVVVGEAYIPYSPVLEFISEQFGLQNYGNAEGAFYDVTII